MEIPEILNRAQTEDVLASREALKNIEDAILRGKEDPTDVFRSFCRCITVVISCRRVELPKSILQLLNGLLKRLRCTKEGRNFMHNLIKYLIRGVDSKLKHVRCNSLVLLRGSIEHLDVVSPRLWAAVKVKIGEKLFDKELGVRMHAVHIVLKYQEGLLDGGLPFYKLLKDLLRYDPSPEIRRTVLISIVTNRATLRSIISRAADTNEAVRLAFVASKLRDIPWLEMEIEERSELLQTLEQERCEEIRAKFLQRFEVVFEEVFNAKFELLAASFHMENRSNASLEKVLKVLMLRYEYADGFSEEFLDRATPALLFLMRVSLRHIDREKGRDTILLPDITVLLKSIIDSSLTFDRGIYAGSVSHALFSLLDYYDVFQAEDRRLLLKCALYLLQHIKGSEQRGVVREIAKMLLRACNGTGPEATVRIKKTLATGRSETQVFLAESLLESSPGLLRAYPDLASVIEEKLTFSLISSCELLGQYLNCDQGQYLEIGQAPDGVHDASSEAWESGIKIAVYMSVLGNNGYVQMLMNAYDTHRSDKTGVKRAKGSGHSHRCCVGSQFSLALLGIIDYVILHPKKEEAVAWVCEKMEELEKNGDTVFDQAASKLLLSRILPLEKEERLIQAVLVRYYSEKTKKEDTQYIHVFLHEYFARRHWMIFSAYKAVITDAKHWKVLNDQIIHWYNHRYISGKKQDKESAAYTGGDLVLLTLSACYALVKEFSGAAEKKKPSKEEKEVLNRYLDLLGKAVQLGYTLSEDGKMKAFETAKALSKHIVRILPDDVTVKNLLFDLASSE